MKHIAKGWHSEIYLTERGTVIKRFKEGLYRNFEKEVRILKQLSNYDFVPKLFSFNNEKMEIEMEYIRGINLREFLRRERDRDKIFNVIKKIFEICFILDKHKIQKEEMNNPEKHIIISDDRIVFIDFERAVEKNRPSNVTQFVEYLYKKKEVLEKFGIKLNEKSKVIEYLKKYKKEYTKESLEDLLRNIFNF